MKPVSRHHGGRMLFGMIAMVGFAGCGPIENSATGVGESEIIGGQNDPNDPAVMLLYAQVPGAASGVLCTASLIAPTVLLTAAHCVLPSMVGAKAVFRAFSGLNVYSPAPSSWSNVAAVHWDPLFSLGNLNGGHDIAVAILATPSSVKPLPINRGAITQAMVKKTVRLVGYGVNNGAGLTGAGVKRQVSTVLDDFNTPLLHIGDTTKQTCEGDSGGPALMIVAGVETVVGLTSFGYKGCTGGGWDTRVDSYQPFLNAYLLAPKASLR